MPIAKFAGVDFSSHEVIELNPDQEDLGRGFRCKRGEFVSYIKGDKIKNEIRTYTSRCWIIHCDDGLAGYITLLADKLSMRKRLLKDENVQFKTFPAVKIGWLAADQRAKGSGTRLLDWAMFYTATELVAKLGIRFMTVDALYDEKKDYDASGFYLKYGFNYTNPGEKLPPKGGYRSMYFDLLPLIQAINEMRSSINQGP